jgi:hypothetical protein
LCAAQLAELVSQFVSWQTILFYNTDFSCSRREEKIKGACIEEIDRYYFLTMIFNRRFLSAD